MTVRKLIALILTIALVISSMTITAFGTDSDSSSVSDIVNDFWLKVMDDESAQINLDVNVPEECYIGFLLIAGRDDIQLVGDSEYVSIGNHNYVFDITKEQIDSYDGFMFKFVNDDLGFKKNLVVSGDNLRSQYSVAKVNTETYSATLMDCYIYQDENRSEESDESGENTPVIVPDEDIIYLIEDYELVNNSYESITVDGFDIKSVKTAELDNGDRWFQVSVDNSANNTYSSMAWGFEDMFTPRSIGTIDADSNQVAFVVSKDEMSDTEGVNISFNDGVNRYIIWFYSEAIENAVPFPSAVLNVDFEVELPSDSVYTGRPWEASFNAVADGLGDVTFYYTKDQTDTPLTEAIDAGVYSVTAVLSSGAKFKSGEFDCGSFEIAKGEYNLSGVTFENKTVTYNGQPHSLAISGTLPSGVSVSYVGNEQTAVNTEGYTVTAKFTGDEENYKPIHDKTAKLFINKGSYNLDGISFDDETVVYDGQAHSLAISGTLPEGITVNYEGNDNTAADTYIVTAKFSGNTDNYEPIDDMTATLTIEPKLLTFTDGNLVVKKDYDGKTNVTSAEGNLSLEGIVSEDVVYINDPMNFSDYDNANAGDNHKVIVSNFVLSGKDKDNYTVPAEYEFNHAVINKTNARNDIDYRVTLPSSGPYNGSGFEASYTAISNGLGSAAIKYIPQLVKIESLTGYKTDDGTVHMSVALTAPAEMGVYLFDVPNGDVVSERLGVTTGRSDVYNFTLSASELASAGVFSLNVCNGPDDFFITLNKDDIDALATATSDINYSIGNYYFSYAVSEAPVNAGKYTVVIEIEEGLNFKAVKFIPGEFEITKAAYNLSGIVFEDDTVTYDGLPHNLAISGTLPEGVSVSYEGNGQTAVNADGYTVTAKFSGDTDNYEPIDDMTAKLVIKKGSYDLSGITFEDDTVTYDGLPHNLAISGTLPEGVSVSYEGNGQTAVNTEGYTVTAKFSGDTDNYEPIDDMTAKLVIKRGTYDLSGITFEDDTVTYDGQAHSLAISGTLPEGVTVSYEGNGQTDVNTDGYTVTAKFSGNTDNYEPITDMTAKLIINKGTYDFSGITFENATVTYDGQEHSIAINGTLPEGVTVSYEGNGKTAVNTDGYTVTAKFSGNADNYGPIADMTAKLIIEPKPLTLTDDNLIVEKNYDGTTVVNYSAGWLDLVGVIPGEDVRIDGPMSFGDYDNADAGNNHKVIVSNIVLSGAHKDNYTVPTEYEFNNAVINKINAYIDTDYTVTIPASGPYTGLGFEATYTAVSDGLGTASIKYIPQFVEIESLTGYKADDGTVHMSVSLIAPAGMGVYVFNAPDGDILSEQLGVTTGESDVYNITLSATELDAAEDFTLNVCNGANDFFIMLSRDSINALTTDSCDIDYSIGNYYFDYALSQAPVNAGKYSVLVEIAENANYSAVKFIPGGFEITKAVYDMSGITFVDDTATYDGQAHNLEITGTLPEGVTVSYDGNGQTEVNTDGYTVTAKFSGDTNNYEPIDDMTAKLVINKGTYDLSGITFEDDTVTYDGQAHSLAISGTLPEGVSVSYEGNDQTAVNADGYTVIAKFSGDTDNYEPIDNMTAKLVINKGTYDFSGITFTDDTVTYDGLPHSLAISGTLPEGVTVSYDGNGQVNANAEGYTVTAKFSGDSSNYEPIADMTAKLIIDKRLVIVTGIEIEDKSADGTTEAIVINKGLLSNAAETDNDSAKLDYDVNAAFEDSEIGADKVVNLTITLEGSSKDNYSLSADSQATATASIINANTFVADMAAPAISTDSNLNGDAADAVIESVTSITLEGDSVDNAAEKLAASEVIRDLSNIAADQDHTIVIVPYIDLKIKSAKGDAEKDGVVSITVDITAKYDAYSVAGSDATNYNPSTDTVVGSGILPINEPITITIPLPQKFVDMTDKTKAFVKHVHNSKTYIYEGLLSGSNITFVDPNGLSDFTFIPTLDTVAYITRNGSNLYFETLADAISEVANGESIVLSANAGSAQIAKQVNFSVVPVGYTYSFTYAAGYSNSSSGNTYTVVYTDPDNNGGGSPAGGAGGGAGGGGAAVEESVSCKAAEGGSVTIDNTFAEKGDKVTLTINVSNGYKLEELMVTDAKGRAVAITKLDDNTYTFVMPGSNVSIAPVFSKVIVFENKFVDVNSGDYYYKPVLWAAERGITAGTDATHFSPKATCTRAQIVTYLWIAAGRPEPKSTTTAFADVKPGSYYYNAVLWAVENGITSGTSATSFSPDKGCTRGQTVTFMYNSVGEKIKSNTVFKDVKTSDYFHDAVMWAKENGITSGTSADTFSPADVCTRGQIVTFLYNYFKDK